MTQAFSLDPVLPIAQVIALTIVAALIAVFLCIRERGGGGLMWVTLVLRGLVVAAVCGLLLNPILVDSRDLRSGKPPLIMLVDSSHSMAVKDVGGKARFDVAKEKLTAGGAVPKALAADFSPKLYGFSDEPKRHDPKAFNSTVKPDGGRTCIGEVLARAIGSVEPGTTGGILLVSDGRNNGDLSPQDVARQAKARGLPVFTVCLGEKSKLLDVSVMASRAQVFAAPEQEVVLSADLSNSGFESRDTEVRLRRNGTVVATKTVRLGDVGQSEVTFPVKEQVKGRYRYTFDVTPLSGEATTTNNKASALLTVGNNTTHVLVLEARPTWDAKFLIQALKTDPAIRVDAVYKLSEDRYFALKGESKSPQAPVTQVRTPTTRAEFAKYDVVILGKGIEDFVGGNVAKALKEYVAEDAGSVVLLRGRPEEEGSALEEMQPVSWSKDQVQDFRMRLTEDGVTHPAFGFGRQGDPNVTIQKLPHLISATKVAEEKALSVVLARASGVKGGSQENREMAVLAYRIYGTGVVVALVGEGLWQWAFLPPDLAEYANCYNEFWTQLIRWLVSQSDFLPGQNITLRTDHQTYSPGEEINFMVFLKGSKTAKPSAVTIEGPDGKKTQVALSRGGGKQADFLGVYRPKTAGEYLATVSVQGSKVPVTATFGVFERRQEDLNTSADPALMKRIAAAGGGEMITLDQIEELPDRINDAKAAISQKTEPQSIWDRWPVLALLLGLLSAEWIIRRRGGMV